MSRELVRLTRELAEAQGVDATMRFFSPDSVYDMSHLGLPAFSGREEIRSFLADWFGSYDDATDEVREVVDLGHGVVFAVIRETAHMANSSSAAEVHTDHAVVVVWDGELAARVVAYKDIDEARAAAERLAEERE